MPPTITKALRKLGTDIQIARKRRPMTMAVMASRMGVSTPTLRKIEAGDPNVLMAHYAMAIFVLGMIDQLAELLAPSRDDIGTMLELERLPKRVRIPGKKRT